MNDNARLEKNILNSVYRYETKKTIRYYASLLAVLVGLGVLLYGFGGAAIDAVVENDILPTFIGMLNGWKSVWFALQASYEMATFAVPIWGQIVVFCIIAILIYIAVSVVRKRSILVKRMRSLIHYWTRPLPREDRQT
jgi:hypothetical protein